MDNSDLSKNRHNNEHLGVNKMGKNIRKSPLHQPNFPNPSRQQPQPQVYNINKSDFRSIVQQLTGSPSREPPPRPPHNPPKPQSMRLQKIRPPPLNPINRPQLPIHPHGPTLVQPPTQVAAVPYGNNFVRSPVQFGQPSPTMFPPLTPGDSFWPNTAESPISAYMRYLQTSMVDSSSGQNPSQPQVRGQIQPQPMSSGLLPNPAMPPLPSPRMNAPTNGLPPLRSPQMNGPPPLPSAQMNGPPPPLLPSPTSQFLLPSPSGFFNLLSPRSPYPLLSPGNQLPPPLTPNFSFSSMAQSGILGPGPQPLPSPGIGFPPSPSGFFPISSPRWRDFY